MAKIAGDCDIERISKIDQYLMMLCAEYWAQMLNICTGFNENRTCSFREILASETNKRTNQRTNLRGVLTTPPGDYLLSTTI